MQITLRAHTGTISVTTCGVHLSLVSSFPRTVFRCGLCVPQMCHGRKVLLFSVVFSVDVPSDVPWPGFSALFPSFFLCFPADLFSVFPPFSIVFPTFPTFPDDLHRFPRRRVFSDVFRRFPSFSRCFR